MSLKVPADQRDRAKAMVYLHLKAKTVRRVLDSRWRSIAGPYQLPPEGDWDIWMLEGGRGAGKTRAGAEAAREHLKEFGPKARVGIGAPTVGDVRRVCAEGPSGLISIAPDEFPDPDGYHRSFPPEATHINGGKVLFMGAEDPARWNGPQWTFLWCDELALWKEESWHQARFGVRLGEHPRIVVTTTPKARKFVRELRNEPGVVVTHGTMYDNPGVSKAFVRAVEGRYGGTRLGRQEIMGEYVEEIEGALWQSQWIHRVDDFPELQRVVVAVDPAVTALAASDETGVVVAGLGTDAEYYVLHSIGYRLSPQSWASHAIDLYDTWHADRIIAEANQGGDMVEATIRQVRRDVPVTIIKASRGKTLRAEPIAALYEQGHVHHWQEHEELEDQMLTFPVANEHDDLVDALVYALTELMGNVVEYDNGGFSDGGRYQIQ